MVIGMNLITFDHVKIPLQMIKLWVNSKLSDVKTYQRCTISQQKSLQYGWCKFAETTVKNISDNLEIMFDISDVFSTTRTTVLGRLYVNIRIDSGNGVNASTSKMEWMYTRNNIDYENFLIAYRSTADGVNIQLWTNNNIQYAVRHIDVVYSTTLLNAWNNCWKLSSRTSPNDLSPPKSYSTIISTPGWQQNASATLDKISGMQKQIEKNADDIKSLSLKVLDITGTTTANGSIQLTNGSVTLTIQNSVIVSTLAFSNTNGVATASCLIRNNNNYFVNCFTADANHTPSSKQEMRVLVYYYDISESQNASLPPSLMFEHDSIS